MKHISPFSRDCQSHIFNNQCYSELVQNRKTCNNVIVETQYFCYITIIWRNAQKNRQKSQSPNLKNNIICYPIKMKLSKKIQITRHTNAVDYRDML